MVMEPYPGYSGWECRKCGYQPGIIMGAVPHCPRCGEEMFLSTKEPGEHPFKKGGPFRGPPKKY